MTSKAARKKRNAPAPDQAGPHFEALEPRLLLSADLLGGALATDYLADKDPSDIDEPGVLAALLEALAPTQSSAAASLVPSELPPPVDLEALAALSTAPTVGTDTTDNLDTRQPHDLTEPLIDTTERHELLFVDARVSDLQRLLDDLALTDETRDIDIIVLDPDGDGIEQVTETLLEYTNLDAVHFVSHGADGRLQLGDIWLGSENLDEYEDAVHSWQQALGADADLLIYGCSLAETGAGQAFIDRLSALTGADVAASNDITGAAQRGGDWALEYRSGEVDTHIAFSHQLQQSWQASLAPAPGGVETDITLWLKADAGVTSSGGDMSQWDNQVTNPTLLNVQQSLAGQQPKYDASGLNYNPVISFDGVNDDLHDASVLGTDLFASDAASIFTVVRVNSGDVILQWLDTLSNRVSVESPGPRFDFGTYPFDRLDGPGISAGYHVVNAQTVPGIFANQAIRIDGLETAQGPASSSNPLDPTATGQLFLGQYPLGGYNAQMDLAEVIVYRSDLSAAESLRVESYLAVKYGLTLDQTTPTNYLDSSGAIIWNAVANNGYDQDIAGIGQDNGSTLNQLVSQSINNDSILTVSLATDQDDGEFLFWANDDGALTETATGTPANVDQQLQRIWRVDETGDLGTTTLTFDLNALPVSGTVAGDFNLIIDNDTDFSSGATLVSASAYAGGMAVFTGVNLNDGQYFTLGTHTNVVPTLDLDGDNSDGAGGNDYQFIFTEGDGATAIADSDTDLVDADSTGFDHVTLAVSGLMDSDAEELVLDGTTFTLATDVTNQNTASAYTVTVTTAIGTADVVITKQGGGTFTEAETETLIEAIQYRHSDGDDPTDGDRLIDVTVNDGTTDSVAATTTINVNPANDNPTGTGSLSSTSLNDNAGSTTLFSGLWVNDVDTGESDLVLKITLSNAAAGTINGGGFTDQGGGVFTRTGLTVAQANTALNNVKFTPADNTGASGSFDTDISVDVDDQGGAGYRSVLSATTVTITRINDAPTANAGGIYNINEGDNLNLNGSGSFDPDNPLIYEWDLNDDSIFGDVTGASPTLDWATLQGLGVGVGSHPVELRVTETLSLSTGSGWAAPVGLTAEGYTEAWFARGRNFDSDGSNELVLGTEPPFSPQDSDDILWSGSGITDTFTVSYSAGTASLTAGGQTAQFAVAGPFTDIYVQTKATGAGNSITVDNLTLELGGGDLLQGSAGSILATSSGATDLQFVRIYDLPGLLSDGFTLTGEVTPTFSGSIGSENLAFDVILANDAGFTPTAFQSDIAATTLNVAPINDAPVGVPNITGTATEDQTLTVDTSGISDADGLGSFSYQWQRSTDGGTTWANVGADAITYTLGDTDVGGLMRVQASYTDAQGTAEGPLSSAATAAVANINDAPVVGNNRLTIADGGTVILQGTDLSATDVDDPDAALLFSVTNLNGGKFELVSNPGVAVTSFTQAQVTGGQVHFVHDGNGAAPAYEVSVSDGGLVDGPLAALISFTSTGNTIEPPSDVKPVPDVKPLPDIKPFPDVKPLPDIEPAPEPIDEDNGDPDVPPADETETVTTIEGVPGGGVTVVDEERLLPPVEIDEPPTPDADNDDGAANPGWQGSLQTVMSAIATRPAALQALLGGVATAYGFSWGDLSALESDEYRQQLDRLRDDVAGDIFVNQTVVGSSIAVSTGLSVGYVLWLVRGGVLLSSVLSSLPAWRLIDPLPVLAYVKNRPDEDQDEEDSLESLVKEKAPRPDKQSDDDKSD